MATSHTEVWQRATVVETASVADGIHRIVLAPEHPTKVDPGAHLDVLLTIDGALDRRSYSIVDAAPDGTRIAVSVFDSPRSRGGAAVMHALRPGDHIDVTQPLLDFPLRIGAARYVLLAGGIGITGVAAMATTLRSLGADYTLIYAGRSRAAMAYLAELGEVHGDRMRVHVGDEGTSLNTVDLVSEIEPGTELYMCGPIRLMEAVRRSWVERELDHTALRFETFGNSGWFEPERFRVVVPGLGLDVEVKPNQTMLEALESAGADMMFDCRKGECGLCEVRVLQLDGEIDHRDVFYSERQKDARSKICCCVSRVVAGAGRPVVTIEY